jgi:hypothetical protein
MSNEFHIILTEEQVKKLFKQLEINDCGPHGETWDSSELRSLRYEITEQLAAQGMQNPYAP